MHDIRRHRAHKVLDVAGIACIVEVLPDHCDIQHFDRVHDSCLRSSVPAAPAETPGWIDRHHAPLSNERTIRLDGVLNSIKICFLPVAAVSLQDQPDHSLEVCFRPSSDICCAAAAKATSEAGLPWVPLAAGAFAYVVLKARSSTP